MLMINIDVDDEHMMNVALSLEEESNRVLEELKEDPRWDFECSPQPISAITYFIAVLNLMGIEDETPELYELVWKLTYCQFCCAIAAND